MLEWWENLLFTIWNPVFNMECGIYVEKVGWNISDFEEVLIFLFAGGEVERKGSKMTGNGF